MWQQFYGISTSLKLLKSLVYSIRPKQWSKNFIIYFAFLFTVEQAWDPYDIDVAINLFTKTTLGFLIFSLLTGAIYLFNDALDIKEDQQHPKKKSRPIPSGDLSKITAIILPMPLMVIPMMVFNDSLIEGLPYYCAAVTGYFSHLFFDRKLI